MKRITHSRLAAILGGMLLAYPATAFAQDPHAGHHPAPAAAPAPPAAPAAPSAPAAAGHDMKAGGHGMMAGMDMCAMMGGMKMSDGIDGRIAGLRAQLAIAPAQQQAWDAFAAALKAAAARMDGVHRQMADACRPGAGGSALERLDRHDRMLTEGHAMIQQVRPALAALYGSLSAEQRQKADSLLDLPHALMPPMQMGAMMGQHP